MSLIKKLDVTLTNRPLLFLCWVIVGQLSILIVALLILKWQGS